MGFVDREAPNAPLPDESPKSPRNTPTLADVYPLALAARQRGDAWIDVEMSGYGREWAPRAAIVSDRLKQFGMWGRVVARAREKPTAADVEVDKGPIARILVRFNVMALLDLVRREEIACRMPRATLAINKRRPRPRNVTIR